MKCFVLLVLAIVAATPALSLPKLTTFGKFNTINHNTKTHKKAFSSSSGKGDGSEQILRNDLVMMKDGGYIYNYETSNGIQGNAQGVGGVSVQGSNSYISPEGIEVKTSYVADETGYHPVGDHIPAIPDYILRALEYIRLHPSKEQDQYSSGGKGSGGKQSQSYRVAASSPKLSTSISPPHRSASTARNSKNQYRG